MDVRRTGRENQEVLFSTGESECIDERATDRLRENAVEVVSTLVTGVWMAALFTGQDWWLAALLVGYAAVVPLTRLLFGEDEDGDEQSDWGSREKRREQSDGTAGDQRDSLETLRERYARGELTEEQFERKLERLLETETIEDVEDRFDDARNRAERSADRERRRERER